MIKKIILIFFLLGIAAAPAMSFEPGEEFAELEAIATEAQVKAQDAINVPIQSAAGAKAAGSTTGTKKQTTYNWIETFVRTTLRRSLLDRLVNDVTDYIQGGGKPRFVTDWREFAEDAGQIAAGEFAQSAGLGFLCSPFQLQIKFALLPVPKFSEQVQCTLDDIVKNVKDFYNDFRNGGWIAYGASWQPQNNFFGALLEVSNELNLRKEAAVFAKINEAVSGGGFLSWKDEEGNIQTPGSTAKDLVSKIVTSDIDFFMSAEQLSGYGEAIASALVNRVIKEGVARVQTAVSRTREDAVAAQYDNFISTNFQTIKTTLLSQIDAVVNPRQQAQTVIDSTILSLNDYKTKLQKLFTDFSSTSRTICPPTSSDPRAATVDVDKVKTQITAEIAQTDSAISQLQDSKAKNRGVVDNHLELKSAVEQLNPDADGLGRLNQFNAEFGDSLDSFGAESLLSSMQAQNNTVNQNISEKLTIFNKQLEQCQASQ